MILSSKLCNVEFATVLSILFIDPMIRNNFLRSFAIFIPAREVWGNYLTDLVGDSIKFLVDSFKLDGAVGKGIFLESLGINGFIRH